ncbi:MAG: dTMP kinase [Chloroflexota bacterium]
MFVTFEGPEGSGKSTQAKLLTDFLESRGQRVCLTREPGGTPLGDHLRQVLMRTGSVTMGARAEVLLFCAARAQLLEEVVLPRLAAGEHVVCDRYADSTLAYQAYGRGLAADPIDAVIKFATSGLVPELTLLLDLPVEEGLRRKGFDASDRFESESVAFHERVRAGYLSLAAADPQRWLVIDARLPIQVIAERIRQRLVERFPLQGGA